MGRERRPHIGIFGRRNNGKSTLINFLAGQDIAIVSDVAGTTTDPVKKSFEITGFGPVILIDTAGIDDTGDLGKKRILKTNQAIKTIDLAILVITQNTFGDFELGLIEKFRKQDVPFIAVHNKQDIELLHQNTSDLLQKNGAKEILHFSNNEGNIEPIVNSIKTTIPESAYTTPSLLGDLISYGDIVLLITPIDIEAPEGRLILPQVQAIRDILDNDAVCIVLKEKEVDAFLRKTGIKPKLVVTDSQVFLKAGASIPSDIALTSFSIMLAHFKGNFSAYLNGTPKISELKDGDKVLLLESCTHHSSCDDIGRVKIPRWISNFTGKQLEYVVVAGLDEVPGDISDYALLIQCGGCMITPKQLGNRLQPAIDAGIPVTNYGMAIAYVQGIYNRAVAPFAKIEDSTSDYL
ncbi:[FeFe] hydrogenase H-cluster maturation GTPase HydF [Labilibaculum sp. DW002]|jgi:[FeFe] hydrogenase H-cluster maturation GTPase HydF|uniref:[FeFe] hydrogenase H-cluster maturation GTPase HydF n=1 Tax=Paralabilibaculum antarcticum TaxID=2912572 RepID=A0ABT5VUK6_9BACT|nr:[FeFe] hydrogenase H-cluster maturation GTPase HydF [Labilibaculum sp. DW002]MDE5418183.1 [FeFe] hydrogenase H-cluster maturation GTPase HydF [Labilibaculum sp. DW002]